MHPARPLNSWDLLKVLGLLLMFVDHAGAYWYLHQQWLRAIGRGSAPIFLYLAGYASSFRFSKELFLLGCLMTLSNILMGEYTSPLNILFTILLCRAVLAWAEKRRNGIARPWEWFIGLAVFSLLTNFIVQYGTLGLMLAISGYMNRRPERYALPLRQRYLMATLVVYGALFTLLFGLDLPAVLLMALVLCCEYRLLTHFMIRPVDTGRLPRWLARLLALTSHYSGYIYALHLIALSRITHFPI